MEIIGVKTRSGTSARVCVCEGVCVGVCLCHINITQFVPRFSQKCD